MIPLCTILQPLHFCYAPFMYRPLSSSFLLCPLYASSYNLFLSVMPPLCAVLQHLPFCFCMPPLCTVLKLLSLCYAPFMHRPTTSSFLLCPLYAPSFNLFLSVMPPLCTVLQLLPFCYAPFMLRLTTSSFLLCPLYAPYFNLFLSVTVYPLDALSLNLFLSVMPPLCTILQPLPFCYVPFMHVLQPLPFCYVPFMHHPTTSSNLQYSMVSFSMVHLTTSSFLICPRRCIVL
jgi:hypothetical protein